MSEKYDIINTSIDKITFVIEYHKKKLLQPVYDLLIYIKNIICCFTDVVYHSSKIIIYTNSVEFTINIEEHNERLDKISLINKRIESIKNNIKKYIITDKKILSCLRTLIINGYNPDELLYLHYSIDQDNFYEYIPIYYDNIPEIKINSEKYSNIGVKHVHIYNPFIDDANCGIFIDESKTLRDFIGYGPNHLHYFEHLVGNLLDLGNYEGLYKYSAFTSVSGICVCTLIEKEEICKRKLKDYIEGRNDMSKGKFDKELIKLEKERVVSETHKARSFAEWARISGKDYNNDTFDLKILQYYASTNYTIVTVSNHTYNNNPFTKVISELNDKLKINRVKQPEVIKYKYMLLNRYGEGNVGYRLYYKDLPKKFKSKYSYIAGVDSVFVYYFNSNKYSSPLNVITALSIVPKNKYEDIAKYKIRHTALEDILDNYCDIF